jgi:hypothetical protein
MQGAQNVLSALFFSAAYMQFLGLAETANIMMRLPVFYKQKAKLFFPGASLLQVHWSVNVLKSTNLACKQAWMQAATELFLMHV